MPSIGRAARAAGIGAGIATGVAGAAVAAERAWVRRARRRPDPDAGRDFLPEFDEVVRIPSHDCGTLAVGSRGSGPVIVLSHGMTLSMRTWVEQIAALSEQGFRVVAFDHRGHGGSECGPDGHSLDNLAADVRSVLETLDLRGAVLVGHSMGGIAVQLFAIRYPEVARERVLGLVLLSTLAKTRVSHSPRVLSAIQQIDDRTPDLAVLMRRPNLGFALARVGFGRAPQPSHVELTREMIAACAGDTVHDATRALLGLDLTRDLPRVTLPTLVISGTADVITPPAEARRIAALVPGARLELVSGGGHMLMLERADLVDRLIVDFARGLGASGALTGTAAGA